MVQHTATYARWGIAFTARLKIKSQSQIFKYGRSIFCMPHRPQISDFFESCLTPARTLFISGLKSRVMKLPFLSLKIMVKSGLEFIWRWVFETMLIGTSKYSAKKKSAGYLPREKVGSLCQTSSNSRRVVFWKRKRKSYLVW